MYITNHLDEIDEINEIDEIILPYTIKANTFSLFRWWDPCDTWKCQIRVRWTMVLKYYFTTNYCLCTLTNTSIFSLFTFLFPILFFKIFFLFYPLLHWLKRMERNCSTFFNSFVPYMFLGFCHMSFLLSHVFVSITCLISLLFYYNLDNKKCENESKE